MQQLHTQQVFMYSEVPIIRPTNGSGQKSGLNSEQVSLMRPIYIEKLHLGTETNGLNIEGGLNYKWSL